MENIAKAKTTEEIINGARLKLEGWKREMTTEVDIVSTLDNCKIAIDMFVRGQVIDETILNSMETKQSDVYNEPDSEEDRRALRFRFCMKSMMPSNAMRKAFILLQVISPKAPEVPLFSAEFPVVFGSLQKHEQAAERRLTFATST